MKTFKLGKIEIAEFDYTGTYPEVIEQLKHLGDNWRLPTPIEMMYIIDLSNLNDITLLGATHEELFKKKKNGSLDLSRLYKPFKNILNMNGYYYFTNKTSGSTGGTMVRYDFYNAVGTIKDPTGRDEGLSDGNLRPVRDI